MNEITNIQNQFGEYLFNFINSKVDSRDDAQDIYQEVILKIITKSDQLNKTESLKSWLFTIARNQIIDFYRARKYSTTIEDTFHLPIEENVNDSAYIQLENCLAGFINQLPEDYKNVIVESEINGKSQKELSKELNLNYVTLRSKVQRGRNKIKELILEACAIEKDAIGRVIECKPQKNATNCQTKNTCG